MNKYFASILLQVIMCLTAFTQNPLSPPGVYIADPSARVWDGKLYIYGSLDESPNYYTSHSYHMLSSSDMKKWTLHRDIFASVGPHDGVPYSEALLYAPDCMYCDGTYYLYYCLNDNTEGVAVSSSPTGPFLYGQKMETGMDQIDPAVFMDDDGQAYYCWGQFTAKGARLEPSMTGIDASTVTEIVTEAGHGFHEGAWMAKREGKYYMVYTQISDRGLATSIGYSVSDSPLGPFEYGGVIIDNFGCDPNTWNNHGSIAEFGGQWYVFYHRATHGSVTMRKACVEPISFRADGTITQVEMTSQGAAGPLDPFRETEAARACLLTGKVRIIRSGESREELARIENLNTATYKYFRFERNPSKFTVRLCPEAGGRLYLFTNNFSMPLNAMIEVPPGDGKTYCEFTVDVNNIEPGICPVYLRFEGEEDRDLFRLDSFRFH